MALPVTITGISTAVAPVGPFKTSVVTQNTFTITSANTFSDLIGQAAAAAQLYQTFTTTSDAQAVASVAVFLSKGGTPTDNVLVDIYALDGTGVPTGASLGTSTPIAATSVTTTATSRTFTFPTPPTVSASAQYAAVFSRSGAFDAANVVRIHHASTNVDSAQFSGAYNGSTWSHNANDYRIVATFNSAPTDAYYFFGRDGTTATTLQAFKSTAPDTSWSSITTKTGFTTSILNIAGCQVGNVIHLLVQHGTASTSLATSYLSFDATTDTFLTTTETVSAAVAVTGQIAGAGAGASLVVRSNGQVVCFYSGVQVKVSGTFRAQVYYRVRTGLNTYGTETTLDGALAVDNRSPIAVLGASDRTHLLYFNGTNTIQRHLTSANVLGTAASTGATTAVQDACRYDSSGTIKHVGYTAAQSIRWDSADNPTVTAASITFGTPVRATDDGTDAWALYQNSTDSDLYVKKSTDNGATFGTAVSAFVGTVTAADANVSKNQYIYTRGTAVVIPYVVNDNGTLKYNEYTVRTTGPVDHPLVASGGSYALTGTATPLLVKRKIDATTGASYALSGASTTNVLHKSRIDATTAGAYVLTGSGTTNLLHKYRPSALGGSYALTGTDAAITKAAGLVNKTLPAGSGSYALTGTDAAVIKRTFKTLAAVGGSYALTGSATGILHAWRPSASTGSYALTGTAATLTKFANKALAAGSGSYALTGTAANVRHGWKVTATTPASYALAGSAATFVIHRDLLSAAPGAYALTGAAVAFSIRSDKFVSAATGSYILTGTAATLRRTYKPAALGGSYALTGTPANPRYGRQVAATAGSYALTGSAASVLHGWKPAALAGSYALTGTAATLQHVWKIAATVGSYALTGTAASVLHRDRLTAINGSYALTGSAALVRYGYKVPAGASSYALTGAAALFPRKRVLTADPLIGRYTLTGKPALVLYRWTLRAAGGVYAITGTPAVLRHARQMAAASSSYALTGSPIIINRIGLHSVVAGPGSYLLTGNVARIFSGEWSISDRTVAALAEVRSAEAIAEIRTAKAIPETRGVKVAAESRHVLAIEEFRTIQARGESHGVSEVVGQGSRRSAGLQHRLVATTDEP